MRKSPLLNKISGFMGSHRCPLNLSLSVYFITNTTRIRLLLMPVFQPGFLAPDAGLLGYSGGFCVCADPAWRLKQYAPLPNH